MLKSAVSASPICLYSPYSQSCHWLRQPAYRSCEIVCYIVKSFQLASLANPAIQNWIRTAKTGTCVKIEITQVVGMGVNNWLCYFITPKLTTWNWGFWGVTWGVKNHLKPGRGFASWDCDGSSLCCKNSFQSRQIAVYANTHNTIPIGIAVQLLLVGCLY